MGRGRSNGDIGINLSVDPHPSVISSAWRSASEKLKDWRPAWRKILPVMSSGLSGVIRSGRGPGGETWAAQNQTYVKRKSAKGFGRTDLVRTGAMLSQIQSQSNGKIRLGPKSVSFGTDKPYARAVNFGVRGKIGSRLFMGWTTGMREEAVRVYEERTREILASVIMEAKASGGA